MHLLLLTTVICVCTNSASINITSWTVAPTPTPFQWDWHSGFYSTFDDSVYLIGFSQYKIDVSSSTWSPFSGVYGSLGDGQWHLTLNNIFYFLRWDNAGYIEQYNPLTLSLNPNYAPLGSVNDDNKGRCLTTNDIDIIYILGERTKFRYFDTSAATITILHGTSITSPGSNFGSCGYYNGWVYMFGGWDDNKIKKINVGINNENIAFNSWQTLSATMSGAIYSGQAVLVDNIYCIGGFLNNAASNKVYLFDTITETFIAETTMNYQRSYGALVYIPTQDILCTYLGRASGNDLSNYECTNKLHSTIATAAPTESNTANPTTFPSTTNPTTAIPTTAIPTTNVPTLVPTKFPITINPTNIPSMSQTMLPSITPTSLPTMLPTMFPMTANPTNIPSMVPTTMQLQPTTNPLRHPALLPTNLPTLVATQQEGQIEDDITTTDENQSNEEGDSLQTNNNQGLLRYVIVGVVVLLCIVLFVYCLCLFRQKRRKRKVVFSAQSSSPAFESNSYAEKPQKLEPVNSVSNGITNMGGLADNIILDDIIHDMKDNMTPMGSDVYNEVDDETNTEGTNDEEIDIIPAERETRLPPPPPNKFTEDEDIMLEMTDITLGFDKQDEEQTKGQYEYDNNPNIYRNDFVINGSDRDLVSTTEGNN